MHYYLFISILITGPPFITVPTQEYRLTPGTDMTLACTAQANPAVIGIFWKKNGVTILASSKYAGATLFRPSLTISNPDESDLGIYTCCATNTFNTETRVCGEDTIMIKGRIHNIDCLFVLCYAKAPWLDKCRC